MQLKCSREFPQCARCLKFSITCVYPEPPDRKMLASLRSRPDRMHLSHGTAKRTVRGRDRHPSRRPRSNSPRCPSPLGEMNGNESDRDLDLEVSAEVQDFLQEIYFSHQFHATLLFHPPTFLRMFEAGQVPQPLLFALFSNSTMSVYLLFRDTIESDQLFSFLPETSPLYRDNASLLRPLGDLQALARRWALRAGRTILQVIDQPTFMSVQVCEMLAMYWFSQGEYRRHTMFLSKSVQLQSSCENYPADIYCA